MKREQPEQNIDEILKRIMQDTSLTDAEIVDIADSPNLRLSVMRSVEDGQDRGLPWPPTRWLARALAVGLPSAVAAALLAAFVLWPAPNVIDTAQLTSPHSPPVTDRPAVSVPVPERQPEPAVLTTERSPQRPTASLARKKGRTPAALKARDSAAVSGETKTEFIALSYARNPDSGQVVRVKVPSAMMVSVGLVQTVEKPTDLIDAEVLVGDDGLTHAIRFIRQE